MEPSSLSPSQFASSGTTHPEEMLRLEAKEVGRPEVSQQRIDFFDRHLSSDLSPVFYDNYHPCTGKKAITADHSIES